MRDVSAGFEVSDEGTPACASFSLLCNGGAMLLQLLHRRVQSAPVNVQIAARSREVHGPEDFAHDRDRHSRFLES
jgi:hypothetical protein